MTSKIMGTRRHAHKLFELHRWLSDIHVKLLEYESVLQASGYEEEETLATLTDQDCEMMSIPRAWGKMLVRAAQQLQEVYDPVRSRTVLDPLGMWMG